MKKNAARHVRQKLGSDFVVSSIAKSGQNGYIRSSEISEQKPNLKKKKRKK